MMTIKFKNFVFFLFLIFIHNIYSQPIPLKVEGRYIKLVTGQRLQIKSINLNDYMEHSYNRWGQTILGQNFQTVLSWLHTADDYVKIKAMGFNTVRLNICPSHFDSIPNLQRIKDHIQWARQNNLYIIIGYFAPRGSVESGGYYDESAFWLPGNVNLRNQFKNDWMQLMNLCKTMGYRNVIYNILNEPQIGFDPLVYNRIYYYSILLNDLLNYKKNVINDSNLVMIDGVSWAQPDFRAFNFINASLGTQFNNHIIYDFHYYMHDFVWRRSKWIPTFYPYNNEYGYLTNNPGIDTVKFNITLPSSVLNEVNIIKLQSLHQPGKYILKYFEIKNLQNSTILLAFDMTGKVIQGSDSNKYILHNGNRWQVNYGGPYFTASSSNMYIFNNNSLVFSNTERQDTSTVDINWRNSYCEFKFSSSWPPGNTQIPIPIDVPLQVKLVTDGDTVHENGSFQVSFLRDESGPYTINNQRIIQNYKYDINSINEIDTIMSSHTDRVNAVFRVVNDMSIQLNKPFILGEFAIPISQRVSENFTYFKDIWYNLNVVCDSMGWSYHAYREPHENMNYPSNNYITVSLFSGRNGTNASVNNIINGINTGQTSFILLSSNDPTKYYINKPLIDTLVRLMNGSFIVGMENLNNSIPNRFKLYQNYPNPFNPSTEIYFDVPNKSYVNLKIYDVQGKQISELLNEELEPGKYKRIWNAFGNSSGIYFIKFETKNYSETIKMVLIK